MPSSTDILASLAKVANAELPYAVAWHVAVAAGLLSLWAGFRIRTRVTGLFLSAPLLSVAVFAFRYGNLFNGLVFSALTVALVLLSLRATNADVRRSSGWPATLGAVLIAFAWCYPHFLDASHSALAYVYAAPMGLIPCPTLSLVIGLSLLCSEPAGRRATNTLAIAGAFYGIWGALKLSVMIDVFLVVGAAGLFVAGRKSGLRTGGKTPGAAADFVNRV